MRRCLEQLRHVVPEQWATAAADPARVLAQSLPDLAGSTHSTRKRTIIGLLAEARSYIRVCARCSERYTYNTNTVLRALASVRSALRD